MYGSQSPVSTYIFFLFLNTFILVNGVNLDSRDKKQVSWPSSNL